MSGPNDLFDCCREYLDACVEAVELTPGGPIERAFISPGPPAWDFAPQLTVHAGGPAQADTAPLQPPLQPLHRIGQTGVVPLLSMTATVLRPSPIPQYEEGQIPVLPSIQAHEFAAATTCADVWSIWNHIANLKRAGVLWPDCREVIFDPAVALNTAGGVSGWQIQVRVALGGYKEVIL